jgi:L,D-transpeptidase ErfK/SrfK
VYDETAFAEKSIREYLIPVPAQGGSAETVIGEIRTYRIRANDTLLDIARYYDLGYNEIVEANPGIDPWLPTVGRKIVLPMAWVLPCCTFEGIVLNIPELRLYFYRRVPTDPDTLIVSTHPVGLGRMEWRTPRGTFEIRDKSVHPRWIIPDSIRRERIRERGDTRRSIPGNDPDNPLGTYRLRLTLPRYAIHGTNKPWGVGRQVSHGCVRLYPEDIEWLFPLVEVGTPVEFTYQPVKVGLRRKAVYVEIHPDIYGYVTTTYRGTLAHLERRGFLSAAVDREALLSSLRTSRGMPLAVSRGSANLVLLLDAK